MKSMTFPQLWKSLPLGAGVNAGIVLGYTGMTLVIARSVSDSHYELLSWGKESYGHGITRNSPEFPGVLGVILNRYLKNDKKIRIWCMIQSKGVETRHLVLPDMAARHLSQAVFWSFKKEVNLTHQDIVFDFDVTGSRLNQDKKEIEVMACSAPSSDLQEIKLLFEDAGYPLTGITVTSFAFQNLFRTGFAGQGSEHIGTLFIGTDWSRIDIFSKGNLILSRDIKTGTRSMTEAIDEQIRIERKEDISIDAYLETDDPLSQAEQKDEPAENTDNTAGLPVGTRLFSDMILEGDPQQLEHAFDRVHPVVDRLIRQIERTFEHFSMTSKGKRVERLYFTGPLCAFGPLLAYTEKQLGVPVSTISPFRKDGGRMTESSAQIIEDDELIPSTGLALSSPAHTLNFNFTYKDKEKKKRNQTLTHMLLMAIVGVAVAGVFAHLGMTVRGDRLDRDIAVLSEQISERSARYGKTGIISVSEKIKAMKIRTSEKAKTHRGAAVLAELSLGLPPDIRLTSFEYQQKDTAGTLASVDLKGLAFGTDKTGLDRWIDGVKASPMIATVSLTHVSEHQRNHMAVHYFESTLELK